MYCCDRSMSKRLEATVASKVGWFALRRPLLACYKVALNTDCWRAASDVVRLSGKHTPNNTYTQIENLARILH